MANMIEYTNVENDNNSNNSNEKTFKIEYGYSNTNWFLDWQIIYHIL